MIQTSKDKKQESEIPEWKKTILSFVPDKLIRYIKNKYGNGKEFDLYGALSKDKDWKIAFQDDRVAIFRKEEN